MLRPLIVLVGARLRVSRWPAGVAVVLARQLPHALTAMPAVLDPAAVAAVGEQARRSTTWTRRHG